MEAAGNLPNPLAELRARRFARECEDLRPLGVAFVLRRFGGSLDHADAEDAVSEVIIRLHRQAAAGRRPDNLRAAFFTSVRNAAIDQLRSRGARPTVPLEAVAEAPTPLPTPQEKAESGDDLVRLREAMARMRPNYREAIVLRFGLGLTVPEIAERLGLSLPAAKKLVLRSTNRIRERMESITGAEFCPEMRELAERSLFDREAAGLLEGSERAAMEAHFEHCGSCRTFLAALHQNLHELGSGALFGGYVVERSGALHHLAGLTDRFLDGARALAAKARLAAYKATGVLQPGDAGAPGAFAGTAQKLAAVCTAGAATTATCLATGIVGPGIGVTQAPSPVHHDHHRPAPKVKAADTPSTKVATASVSTEPQSESPAGEATEATEPSESTPPPRHTPTPKAVHPTAAKKPSLKSESTPTPSQQTSEEFGFESESEARAAPAPEPTAPTATASSSESTPAPSPSSSSSSSSSTSSGGGSGGGTEKFGFGG
jgi:RNA polymerase sigma-70 factor, ECF subfamily